MEEAANQTKLNKIMEEGTKQTKLKSSKINKIMEEAASQTKLNSSKINTFNRSCEWTPEKDSAIQKAMEEYPHIPQIAIEACYDFALKYQGDTTIEKYIKGEILNDKQLKKINKIIHPNNYFLTRDTYHDGQIINNVNIIKGNL